MSGSERCSLVGSYSKLPASLLMAIALAVTPFSSGAQATVAGSVTDTSGVPIVGARVTVAGSRTEAQTDQKGSFRLSDVPLGATSVRVRRLGFVPFEVALEVGAGVRAEVRVRMIPIAATLPAVVVRPGHMSYKGRLAGYYSRLEKKSSGVFISREEIDRLNPSRTGQLLANIPGVRSLQGPGGITGIRMRGRRCWPLVWIDGMPMPVGEVDLDSFVPSSIQGIELYLGSTTAPMAYLFDRSLSSCGTILIWSRGPDTDPIHNTPAATANLNELVTSRVVHTAQNVDRQARLDSSRVLKLGFPPSLYASGTRGLVVAEFVVDSLGRVEGNTLGIVSSTAPLFTDAVVGALAHATFLPALKDGRPVRQLVQQPFAFDVGNARPADAGPKTARSPGQ